MLDPVPVTNCNFVSSSCGRRREQKGGEYLECGMHICFRMFILKI